MDVVKIPLTQLVISDLNVREDIGNLEDLAESIADIGENIFPLAVQLVDDKYEIIHGKRRFSALKEIDAATANCVIVDLNNLEKFKLMYYENLGRKELTWPEEVKALKLFREFSEDIKTTKFVEDTSKKMNKTKRTVWRIMKMIDAIEEFPELVNESSRSTALEKYEALKKLDEEKQKEVKDKKVSINKALEVEKNERIKIKTTSEIKIVDELRKEVDHYKHKFKDIKNIVSELETIDINDRIESGIWLEKELIDFVEAARMCEAFGQKNGMSKEDCEKCKKETNAEYRKCDFWHGKFKK